MTVLFIASIVGWAHFGNAQLRANWQLGRQDNTSASVARQLFNGICIGVLGVTGFECEPVNCKRQCGIHPDTRYEAYHHMLPASDLGATPDRKSVV